MFSLLNLMIFSVCSRWLPFILSHRVPLYSPFFHCGFPQGTSYFPRMLPLWIPRGPCTSTMVPQPGYPLFCPFFPCEFPQGTSCFPRISTVGSPCVYVTISPWVRPSNMLSHFARDLLPFSRASSNASLP